MKPPVAALDKTRCEFLSDGSCDVAFPMTCSNALALR
jgi:hypothetical protein